VGGGYNLKREGEAMDRGLFLSEGFLLATFQQLVAHFIKGGIARDAIVVTRVRVGVAA
jgi:hypothetical protein